MKNIIVIEKKALKFLIGSSDFPTKISERRENIAA
jgi:hypothetical protein